MVIPRTPPGSSSFPDRFNSSEGRILPRLAFAMPAIPGTRWTVRDTQAPEVGSQLVPAMHNLPREILEGVFFFTVLGFNSVSDSQRALHNICSVDREWRNTAINYPILWTRLPPADFDDSKQTTKYRRRVVDALKLYLARSGALPISFTLRTEQDTWINMGSRVDVALAAARLLVAQCHRWDEVELKFSSFAYTHLAPIKGKLPLLTRLKLEMPLLYLRDQAFDLFGDAPRLRNAHCYIHWCYPDGTSVVYPWFQLENFAHATKSNGLEVYHLLLDSQPTSLRSLEYQSRNFVLLPASVSIPLPFLEKLVLRIAGHIECDMFSHLDILTLPALTHLELWGRLLAVPQDAYDVVRNLVERSGCSLQTLFLCLSNNQEASSGNFRSLIALCPGLEELHLAIPESGVLRALLLEPDSDETLLPRLRTLGLHSHGPTSWDNRVLEGGDLAMVIKSRTKALRDRQEPHSFRTLDEVLFVYYANIGVQYTVLREAFIKDLDDNVDQGSKMTIEKALESLHWSFTERGAWLYRRQNYNPLFLAKMERAMRGLEGLSFKKRNTEVLLRYGLPSIIHRIGHYCDDRWLLPSDVLLLFRVRARRLVKKWKPFVLRDARTAKFRWCYYGGGVVRLGCNQGSEGIEESDEDIWKDILGIGEDRSKYTSLKEWTSII